MFLSTFFLPISTEGWKCDFFVRHTGNNFMLPKRRCWKEEQKAKCGFRRKHFSSAWVLNLGQCPLKSAAKIRISSFVPPSNIFVWWLQKIVATCDVMRWFLSDATIFCNNFTPPKRRFWKSEQTFRTIFSKHFSMVSRPNEVLTYVKSALKTSRRQLIPIFDKPAFSRISQIFKPTIRGSECKEIREKAGLSKMGMSCRRLLKTRSEMFVRPSKIFVWGA